MRIAIIASGSQGDVQPYIALGKGLSDAGHAVRIVTHENYEKSVRAYGLDFYVLKGNPQEVMETEEIRALLEKGNFLAINAHTSKLVKEATQDWARAGLAAFKDAELLIAGVGGLYVAFALAEKLNIPFLQAYVFPFTPTKAFPTTLAPKSVGQFGGGVNKLSHSVFRQIMWQSSRAADNLARKNVLNLPPAPFMGPYSSPRFQQYPALYGFSPSVLPQPSDWQNAKVTGYWFLESSSDWTPPQALTDFLQKGSPPVYIGFGSMGSRKPEETANLVLAALEKSKQRAILLSGWSGMKRENMPDSVLLVDSVPHSWLFPRVAAVVHHGGAGTTAAGLRAGVPSIVIPFFGDQPFWGERVAELGVGPKPIPRKTLTAENLASAIQTAVTDKEMRQRAAALGKKIQAENGIASAVAVIAEIEKRKTTDQRTLQPH
ncbi:MAG: glycosyltransferase [Trueperaceae bacterium]